MIRITYIDIALEDLRLESLIGAQAGLQRSSPVRPCLQPYRQLRNLKGLTILVTPPQAELPASDSVHVLVGIEHKVVTSQCFCLKSTVINLHCGGCVRLGPRQQQQGVHQGRQTRCGNH